VADEVLKDEKGRFLTGTKPGPGRPPGSKARLAEDFFRDISEAWAKDGIDALTKMIAANPDKFVQVVANLMPKEMVAEVAHKNVVALPERAASTEDWQSKVSTHH